MGLGNPLRFLYLFLIELRYLLLEANPYQALCFVSLCKYAFCHDVFLEVQIVVLPQDFRGV